MKVLAIGDFHIPNRANKIPEKFKEEIEKADLVLCTGDLTDEEIFEFLKEKSKDLRVIKGNCDFMDFPVQDIVNTEGLKIGLIHGDQVGRGDLEGLKDIAEKLGVQILVSGHSHKLSIKEKGNIGLINPGSATGAWSGGGPVDSKSCLVLYIENGKLKDIEKLKENI